MVALQGPRGRALTTWRLMTAPFDWYPRWRDRFGPTFEVRALNGDVVVLGDPDDVKRLFATREVRPFGVEAAAPLVGPGSLLLVSGERHRRERRLLTPPFHGERMRAYGTLIRDIASSAAASWRPGQTVSIGAHALDVSLEVILRAVFGVTTDVEVQRYREAVAGLVAAFHPGLVFFRVLQRPMFGIGPWDRFVRHRDALDALLYRDIDARRASGERGPDILSLLLDATYEDGSQMDRSALRDQLVTLLIAGHETTQITITWAMSWLHRHPATLARLREELDSVDPEVPDALARLPWLDAVATETLRLNPIAPDIVRTLTAPLEISEGTLPAGAHVAPVAALVHTDPTLYPDPHAFRPERWLDRRPRPHEWLPFGGGVRRCIGAALATYELKIVLATWLRAFTLALPAEAPAVERVVRRNLTMAPASGIPLHIVGRRSPTRAAA